MNRSVIIGLVIVIVLGVAAWILTGTQRQSSNAPNGQSATASNPGDFREQMTQFREQHKYTEQLTRLAGNIGRLAGEGQHKLTAKQAKQALDILQPLRTQPKLTQDEAKEAQRAIQAVLTVDQRTEINKMPERRVGGNRNSGPGGPGGQGRMSGPGQGGAPRGQAGQNGGRANGQRRQFDPEAMKNYNPFNLQSGMGGSRAAARWDEFFKALEAKATK